MKRDIEPNEGLRTVRARIRCFLMEMEGSFRTSDIYEALGAKTTDAKAAIRQGLSREKGKTIEAGGAFGIWRKIDDEIKFENLSDPDSEFSKGMDVMTPLGLDKIVTLYDGDLIVLAGTTNTGKSSFALELASKNAEKNNVVYFSSELTRAAIQERARLSGIQLDALRKIKFAMRFDNFQDVVSDDGSIYIVDYLQAPGVDEPQYWAIPHLITKIHNKLKGRGLILVCLQKDAGKRTGDGGFKTLHRSGLYLTTDKDDSGRYWMNIQKCKSNSQVEGYGINYKLAPFGLSGLSDWIPIKANKKK